MIRRLIVIVSVVLALSGAVKVCCGESTIARDGFENGITGGAGWSNNWALSVTADTISNGNAHSGTYALRLRSNTGLATRTVNMAGVVSIHNLSLWWKAYHFETGEYATVDVFDGSWHTVLTVSDGQDDNIYHLADVNLSGYNMVSNFQIRAASHMGGDGDFFYIDDILIAGTLLQHTISGTIAAGSKGVSDVNLIGLGVVTDSNGFYAAEVDYGFSGVVTPAKPGYTFDPNSRSYTNVTADLPDQNFAALPLDNFNDNRRGSMWRTVVK